MNDKITFLIFFFCFSASICTHIHKSILSHNNRLQLGEIGSTVEHTIKPQISYVGSTSGFISDVASRGAYDISDWQMCSELEMILGYQQQGKNLLDNGNAIYGEAPENIIDGAFSNGEGGNVTPLDSEGTYGVSDYFNSCLLQDTFEVKFDRIFRSECDEAIDVQDITDNLLLHYALDGSSVDSGPLGIDGSNNGGQLITDRLEMEQGAIKFDGESHVEIPHDDRYKVQFPISVSVWVKWESSTPQKNAVFSTNYEIDNYHGVFMLRTAVSGKIFFGYGTGTGGVTLENRRAIQSDNSFDLNKWHHVVGTINGPNEFELYVNGCPETFGLTGAESPSIAYNSNSGFLGKVDNDNNSLSNDLIGTIDDFYFWNRIITEEEVLYLYDRFEIPELNISDQEIKCDAEVTVSVPPIYSDVQWSDGQTGNVATFSEEGVYKVEALYNCHLVCTEFEVSKEDVFTENCNQTFDNCNIDSDLVLHYLCNGNAIDESVNQLNGQMINVNFVEDRFGNAQGALSFNGINSSIVLPETSILEVQYPASLSAWVYFDSDINGQGIIFDSNTSINNYRGLVVNKIGDGRLFFTFGGGEGGTSVNNRRSGFTLDTVPLKEWLHVVAVYHEIENVEIYINGCKVEVGYSGTGAEAVSYNSDHGHIGKTTASNLFEDYFFMKGFIDDLYFWSRSITEEEVLYLYNRFNVPDFELLDSYDLCENDEVTININPKFTNVIWSDGIEGNSRTLTEAGIYNVEGFYNCHLVCKEITVTEVPEELQLGEDIITCSDQIILTAPVNVEWSTGDVSNFLLITESGTYSAFYQSECSFLSDTIRVELLSEQSIDLQDNYVMCQGTSIMLSIDEGYESVAWSNGSSGNSITISQAGAYQVIAEELVCPPDTHVFSVQVIDTIPHIEVDASILLCDTESTTISIPEGPYQTTWNDTLAATMYTTSGNEEINLTLSNECDVDAYSISVRNVMPVEVQSINASICTDDSIVLSGPEGVEQYVWSTLDTTKSITVKEEGIYTLSYNKDGCVFDAQVADIETQICIECEFYFPNVISVGSTSGNNEFIVRSNYEECLSDIQVEVFDRWGNQIFLGSSQDPWEGYYKNRKVEIGVYVVHISGIFNDTPINLYKDLTVLD